MASYTKRKDGKWRAQIARKGVRRSKIFATKQLAKDWASREEYLILNAKPVGETATLGEAMHRYAREVSPTRRGERWEVVRLKKLRTYPFSEIIMADLAASDFAEWRDKRLKEVSPGTVKREMELISGVLSVARKEWGYITVNPMADVRRPSKPPARDRLVTKDELDALAISAGDDLSNATARVFHSFLFAIETAMRAGEITGLTWESVDLNKRVAFLPRTKNGTSRHVPLSSEAVRLLQALPHADPIFNLDDASRDALWRKLRDRAGIVGLRFHDSRHEAITRLAKKLHVLDLARMVGHRDLRQLQFYYNERAEDIARKLD